MKKREQKDLHQKYAIQAIFAELETKNSEALDTYFTPNLNPIDTLRVVLYKFALLILLYKERLIVSSEEENLHQFRISIRKSRAFLKEFDFLLPELYQVSISDTLAQFARQTNHKRDLDVMQAHLASSQDTRYDGIWAEIEKKKKQELSHIQSMLKSEAFDAFFTRYLALLKNATLLDTDYHNDSMKHVLKKVVKQLHQKIIKKITRLEKDFSIEKLHSIRIALKRLRYLLEEFKQILGVKKVEKIIKKGKTLQTLLGDFNDSITQENLLHDYLDGTLANTEQNQTETLAHIMKKLHRFRKEDFIL